MVNLKMDSMLYRTADLAPFPGEPQGYNTIFALNILFRAVKGQFPKIDLASLHADVKV